MGGKEKGREGREKEREEKREEGEGRLFAKYKDQVLIRGLSYI